jgi:hypothetical protein
MVLGEEAAAFSVVDAGGLELFATPPLPPPGLPCERLPV